MRKMYIDGPADQGEGVYSLVLDDGELLATHFCSSSGFAKGDLEAERPERQDEWKKRFGEYEVLFIGEDDMTRDKLIELNKNIVANLASKGVKDEDGSRDSGKI